MISSLLVPCYASSKRLPRRLSQGTTTRTKILQLVYDHHGICDSNNENDAGRMPLPVALVAVVRPPSMVGDPTTKMELR